MVAWHNKPGIINLLVTCRNYDKVKSQTQVMDAMWLYVNKIKIPFDANFNMPATCRKWIC